VRRSLIAALGVGVVIVGVVVLRSRSRAGARTPNAPSWPLNQAIDEAASYLARVNDTEGRFEYRLFTDGRHGSPRKYNILRHAGSIYALGDYATQAPTPEARAQAGATAVRATRYMLEHYVRPLPDHPDVDGVWSDPKEEGGQRPIVKLGANGLGLIGLMSKARAAEVDGTEMATARAMARFIVLTQKPSGDFRGNYDEEKGYLGDSQSLYYPGEAILGLTMLYERDHDKQWLETAVRAVARLVESRRDVKKLPNDHWLMIAIDRLLPSFGDLTAPPLSREAMVDHAVAIGQTMLDDMTHAREKTRGDPDFEGSFNAEGRTTPNATRLEGMLALDHALDGNAKHAAFRAELRASIAKGIAFLRRAQVKEGVARGGMPAAITDVPDSSDPGDQPDEEGRHDRGDASAQGTQEQREVRIDYVQHAMSAMMRYRALCASDKGAPGCGEL
jgi:hypothetical protein